MNYAIRILAAVAVLAAGTAAAMAQADQTCHQLRQRTAWQDSIRTAYSCQSAARPEALQDDNPLWQRCARIDRYLLGKALNRRAAALELCIIRALASSDRVPPGVTQQRTVAQETVAQETVAQETVAQEQGGAREQGRALPGPGRPAREAVPPTLGNQPLTELLGSRRGNQQLTENQGGLTAGQGQGDRIGAREGEDAPRVSRDLTFRTGLVWSYAGPISGMSCTQWLEPSDPDSWEDNFLCAERDVGFQWSFRGPIQGRGLNCIQVREKSDPHDWHDNYFCWPRDLRVTFRFSATGRIDGFRCLAIVEPSDPHTWRDNYLCHRPETE